MDLSGIPHPAINWDSTNLPDEWNKFQQHVDLLFSGPLSEKAEEQQIAYLLLWVGQQGRQLNQTWKDGGTAPTTLEGYYDKFKGYVQPKLNPIFGRYRFNNEVQGTDKIDVFVTRLRLRARDCKYEGKEDEMIRDRIVFGCNNSRIREKLINEGEKLTLDKAIQIAQNFEYCQQQLSSMSMSIPNQVDAIHKGGRKPNRWSQQQVQTPRAASRPQGQGQACRNCGTCHARNNCPAYGKKCHLCKKHNHFQTVCRSVNKLQKKVHDVTINDDSCDTYGACGTTSYFIDTVSTVSYSQQPDRADRIYVPLLIGPSKSEVKFKIDTGSACNIIPSQVFKKLKLSTPLEPSDSKLTSYSGDVIRVLGRVSLTCSHNSSEQKATFYVVENSAPAILGLNSSLDLGLIKLTYSVDKTSHAPHVAMSKESVLTEFKDLFQGIGNTPGYAKLHLVENAVPVVNPPRRVPEALKIKFKEELDRMLRDGIIAKVTEPTDWVNSVVLIEKPKTGKLRVCIDPKVLNENIRRPHYPMPTLEDITSELSGATHFSILDITHAYWSVKLDHESSLLTTFSTPFGRYRYLRLPFGIVSSGDIFMQKCNVIFEGLSGIRGIVDDLLVYGRSKEEHDANLRNALLRAQDKGVKFNPEKCIIGVNEVPFFGHIISAQGLKPDPAKVEAIAKLEIPDCRGKLETFLGMVNYMSKFSENLAEVTTPLRSLLHKDSEFLWDEPQTRAFNKVKGIISNAPVLGYFDQSRPLILECDASQNGLGCCLMQEGRPLAYASKSLTNTEKMYANIEREMLAIVFGCKRFHQFTYGRHVIVRSDHRPLAAIMKKPLCAAPPRLQRLMLSLQKYNVTVEHVPGKDIPVSDCLSRHSISETYPALIEDLDTHVHAVMQHMCITDRRIDVIRQEICAEHEMQILKQTIINGWPETRAECNRDILDYWNHRDELSYESGLIFRGQKLLVPKSLRDELVKQVHTGHLGVNRTVERAKDCLFWPGMIKQVTDHVLRCSKCLKHRDSNSKDPMVSVRFPDRPYEEISTDLFHFDGKDYLLTTDHYSRFFEIDLLPDTRSATVIRKLQGHMSRNGICDSLHSDNGPQFSSSEFAEFAKTWNFEHKTSSPLHPQGNCIAERGVGIAKKLMAKARDSGQNPYIALLEYRNTPLECGYSPSQLLFSRRTKSVLPVTNKALKPQVVNQAKLQKSMKIVKAKSKANYDKSSKPLAPLLIGDSVRIRLGKIWFPAKVFQKHDQRSYTVHTRDGKYFRRNRSALHKTSENTSDIQPLSFNILADQQNSIPETPSVNIAQKNTGKSLTSNSPYVTRSGRVVKGNVRYQGNEWV